MNAAPDLTAEQSPLRQGVVQAVILGFLMVFVLAGYAVLHEGGHAVLGLLFGGTISEFDVSFWDLSAHVGIEGEFTLSQQALISVAGVGLPYLVYAGLVGLGPREVNPILSWLRLVGSLAVVNSLLGWVALPLLHTQGLVLGDDSINFLGYTQAHPLLVSAGVLVAYVGGWLIFIRRVGSPRALIHGLRHEAAETLSPASLASLRALAALFVVGVAAMGGVTLYLSAANPLALPPGYSLVRVIDLSEREYADEVVYRFNLEHAETVSLHFVIEDVASGPMAIVMDGPNGYSNAFLRFGTGSGIGRAKVRPQGLKLLEGEYAVRLTFPQVPGRVVVAVRLGA